MARITISVTDELRVQMDKRSDLNWSLIAREAFTEAMRTTPNPKVPTDPFAYRHMMMAKSK
jgi:hypothetical protein